MSTGQIFRHFPQRVQVSGSQASCRKLVLLNSEKIAPSGQAARQKGRLAIVDTVTKNRRIAILTQNSDPIMARTPAFIVAHGIPPSRVPAGHSFENQCSPVRKGTDEHEDGQRRRSGDTSPTAEGTIFQDRNLYSRSWRAPKGHRVPHVMRPTDAPTTDRVPMA